MEMLREGWKRYPFLLLRRHEAIKEKIKRTARPEGARPNNEN